MEELGGLKPLTALDYFEVNKGTFLTIITNAVAYLVILLQFLAGRLSMFQGNHKKDI